MPYEEWARIARFDAHKRNSPKGQGLLLLLLLLLLDLRHEETFQSARSRQHRSRIVDKQIVFFANRVDGVVVGSQIEPAGAPRNAQSSQIEPARAAGAARSSQTRPNRASKGARGSQSEPIEARSSQQGRPGRAQDAQAAPAGRPADRASARTTARRAISLWKFNQFRRCRRRRRRLCRRRCRCLTIGNTL